MTAYEATQEILNTIPLCVWEILDSMGATEKLEENVNAIVGRSIEDCAKIADEYRATLARNAPPEPMQIAKRIRALAGKKEEVKANDR